LLRIVRICAKAQMLIHSAVPPLPHKIIFDAFPGTPLCEIAVLQTARFHPKENCIFLALLCSYPFARYHKTRMKKPIGNSNISNRLIFLLGRFLFS
jgi:hypothetical protein